MTPTTAINTTKDKDGKNENENRKEHRGDPPGRSAYGHQSFSAVLTCIPIM
jgi:hypothetical protein